MLKNVLFCAALLAASLAFGAAEKPANYSGAWSLDMKQSKNLPPFYANVQSHKLNVTQDEKHLRVSADGKTLNIHRTDDTRNGKIESDMVFVKG
ncbi:MAG: hypothetical protein QOH49_4488 [Acidobacteriota bacterium]|nr:hypothetical protein [Acidobacteriota bacterium]